jgi:two-component system CheB/CheR fusion protein
LATINDEAQQRGDEVNEANRFLQAVLTGLHSGVAVVDRELRVLAWSSHAEELWGVRPGEVTGQHLLNLDIGLPIEHLRPVIRAALGGDGDREQLTVDAVNRRGKSFRCRVTCSPLLGADGAITGAILLMEEDGASRRPT